ncbi:MAG: hypothetical protein HYZ00_03440, partial [Candidatus Hydrogenedentes bacterium]|nr:hypothetical protein [Candidatus Hydrogenedentota bacterium]
MFAATAKLFHGPRRCIAVALALSLDLPLSAAAQPPFAPLPGGKTLLTELGYYQVSYQSYDGAPVNMSPGWTGTFDTASGICYSPNEFAEGLEAMLIHSPWRVPVGKTWVDYPVHFPAITPITLRFGIAMRADSLAPDKSDGATFSCALVEDTGTHELLRRHYAAAQWLDFSFDLAPYAGRDVTLRLQIEPGPSNNPGWDYSYFSTPELLVGGQDVAPAGVKALRQSRAVQATAGANLAAAANRSEGGVYPSNLLEYRNSIQAAGKGFTFGYEGTDCRIVYTYAPDTGTLDDFTAAMDEGPVFQPALGGGVTAALPKEGGEDLVFLRGGTPRSVELSAEGNALEVVWEYPLGESVLAMTWRFGIRGKALTVQADCEQPVLSSLSLGTNGNVAFRKQFSVPYLLGSLYYLPAQGLFSCRYLDWTASHASQCPQGEAAYERTTAGARQALHESGYIAISPAVAEVLPNIPNPPSPYLAALGPRIMLDIWQHHNGTYAGDAENLRNLKDNGVDHLAIISHVWQRYGYDVKLPDHIPANPQFGGEEGMKEFGQAANECGYLWSLHENYIDLYPDAPSYDPAARVLREDGTPSPGWFNAGTGVQSFGLKCTRALGFARQNSPEIHARYGTTAAYLDVHTCVPPWHQVDHDPAEPLAAMALLKIQRDTELFQFERDTHGGPLFGEGNQHFFWAGRCDGVEAQVAGGEDHAPLLDFDLLKIHPQMVNHGMGYYERWFRRGYSHQWGLDTGTPEQVDKYRAQEIAYGHAGFIGAAQTDNVQWVAKEHHLMHPIQRLMNTAKVTSILYEVDGSLAPVGVALVANQRLRQHIQYASG